MAPRLERTKARTSSSRVFTGGAVSRPVAVTRFQKARMTDAGLWWTVLLNASAAGTPSA
jgi:hypothetical protein